MGGHIEGGRGGGRLCERVQHAADHLVRERAALNFVLYAYRGPSLSDEVALVPEEEETTLRYGTVCYVVICCAILCYDMYVMHTEVQPLAMR
jgi:hypothetical protein